MEWKVLMKKVASCYFHTAKKQSHRQGKDLGQDHDYKDNSTMKKGGDTTSGLHSPLRLTWRDLQKPSCQKLVWDHWTNYESQLSPIQEIFSMDPLCQHQEQEAPLVQSLLPQYHHQHQQLLFQQE